MNMETGGEKIKGGAKLTTEGEMGLASYIAKLKTIQIPELYARMIFQKKARYTIEKDGEGQEIVKVFDVTNDEVIFLINLSEFRKAGPRFKSGDLYYPPMPE